VARERGSKKANTKRQKTYPHERCTSFDKMVQPAGAKDRVVTAISSEGADHFRMAAILSKKARPNASGLVAFVDLAKELGKIQR